MSDTIERIAQLLDPAGLSQREQKIAKMAAREAYLDAAKIAKRYNTPAAFLIAADFEAKAEELA